MNAWKDGWLSPDHLIEDLGIVVPDDMKNMMVKDLVDVYGCLNIGVLNSWLPTNIISKLHAVNPPSSGIEMDRRTWCGFADGRFAISSAYTMLCKFNDDSSDPTWLRIWSLKIPERIRSFIWLVRHDRLITSSRKSQMHIGEPWCHHCVDTVEDVLVQFTEN